MKTSSSDHLLVAKQMEKTMHALKTSRTKVNHKLKGSTSATTGEVSRRSVEGVVMMNSSTSESSINMKSYSSSSPSRSKAKEKDLPLKIKKVNHTLNGSAQNRLVSQVKIGKVSRRSVEGVVMENSSTSESSINMKSYSSSFPSRSKVKEKGLPLKIKKVNHKLNGSVQNLSVSQVRIGEVSRRRVNGAMENASTFIKFYNCKICAEKKPQKEFFSIKGCSHYFCAECIVKYIASKTKEGISSIKCPDPTCKAVLAPDQFAHHSVLPKQVYEDWCSALCEALISGSQRFYCPFKDCSGLLVAEGGAVVKESECPYCHRLFCAQCRVSWHSGMECKDYQKSYENKKAKNIEAAVLELAKQKKWQKCPNCKFYVERTQGCTYMKCRCGSAFCYTCGASRPNASFCTKCKH